jgi:hypothetical protein
VARAPNNTLLHLILKYDSAARKVTIKINNVLDPATLTLPAPISWPTAARGVPLALGGNPEQFSTAGVPALSEFFYGMLSNICAIDVQGQMKN